MHATDSYQDDRTTWHATSPPSPGFPVLDETIDTDVAIIGGGMTGMLSAYLLQEKGLNVAVLHNEDIGGEATGKTTGFITQSLDTPYADWQRMIGPEEARLLWHAHGEAKDVIERIVKKHAIDCEWQTCSNYTFSLDKDDTSLKEETEAARKLGLTVKTVEKDWPFAATHIQETPEQAKINALRFVRELSRIVAERGGRMFEHTRAEQVKRQDGRMTVHTPNGRVHTTHVISATHFPFGDSLKMFFSKGTYTTYVYELRIPKGYVEEATYEDTHNPYHYFRVDAGKDADRMIIGGEDHRSDIPVPVEKNFDALKAYIDNVFPAMDYTIVRQWKGPILEPIDGRAYIGCYDGMWYGTAYSGNGMTHAGITALICTDGITGKENPYAHVFDPSRIPEMKSLLQKGVDYGQELWGGAVKNAVRR